MIRVTFKEAQLKFTATSETLNDLKAEIGEKFNLPQSSFYLTSSNGKLITDDSTNIVSTDIQLHLRMLGGKGGFGSMLRAIGAQIEKTTNREACRDLSGRRLRDINEEKRLKAWIEAEKNKTKEDPDEKFNKKIGKLLAVPKKEFNDPAYNEARSNLLDNINESLEQGLKKKSAQEAAASSSGLKRKSSEDEKQKRPVKKIKGALWIDEGISSGSDSDDDDDCEEVLLARTNRSVGMGSRLAKKKK